MISWVYIFCGCMVFFVISRWIDKMVIIVRNPIVSVFFYISTICIIWVLSGVHQFEFCTSNGRFLLTSDRENVVPIKKVLSIIFLKHFAISVSLLVIFPIIISILRTPSPSKSCIHIWKIFQWKFKHVQDCLSQKLNCAVVWRLC